MTGRAAALPPPTPPSGCPADARSDDPAVAAALARAHTAFTEGDDPPPSFTVLPTVAVTLICNVGAPFAGLPTAFVSGPTLAPASVARRPGTVCIDVKLSPPAAHTVIGVPLYELAGSSVDLADLTGTAGARLAERVRSTASWDERFATHLVRHAVAGPVDWGQVAAAYGYADQAHLCRDVQRLAGTTPTRLAALVDPGVEVPFVQDPAEANA